ncbi:alanine racemase, partial [Streptomyces sp. SID10244]|nr:alanine racemase [Streptomyces sp. SID10244]
VPRLLSGKFAVRINGRSFPGVGRICMDQMVVDIGPDGGGVAEGDRAELFGTGRDGGPTAKDWADTIGTIDYEIVSGIGRRAIREYVGGARG